MNKRQYWIELNRVKLFYKIMKKFRKISFPNMLLKEKMYINFYKWSR